MIKVLLITYFLCMQSCASRSASDTPAIDNPFAGKTVSDNPAADLYKVRNLFLAAAESESKCDELLSITENATTSDPVMLGYHGVAKALMAKYSINPYNKLSYFKKGKNILESAISAAPNNVELRYLRLTIQENVPGILGYSGSIDGDRAFIMQKLPGITDSQLSKMIRDYLASKK